MRSVDHLFIENFYKPFSLKAMSIPQLPLLSLSFEDPCRLVFIVCVQCISNVLKLRPLERNLPPGTKMFAASFWGENLFFAFSGVLDRALWLSRLACISSSPCTTLVWGSIFTGTNLFVGSKINTAYQILRHNTTWMEPQYNLIMNPRESLVL